MLQMGIYSLMLACIFGSVGASPQDAPPASVRLLIAEISEKDTLASRQATIEQKLDMLKSKGYRIVQEREVAFAIPPTYFRHLNNLTELMEAVDLFQDYEMNSIPEKVQSLVKQIAQSHNRSSSEFSKITFGVAVVAVFETKQTVGEVEILPGKASKQEVAAFFSGDLQSWKSVVQIYADELPEGTREILKDVIRGLPSDAHSTRRNVLKGLKSDSNPSRDTQTMVLFSQSVPSWRVWEEEKAYFLVRYYQLVQREVANERARWHKAWQHAFQQALGERPDWKGWHGNIWEGPWNQLPVDIRQKITTLLQAEGVTEELQESRWQIRMIPYIGFIQHNDIGTYSEWFPVKVIAK